MRYSIHCADKWYLVRDAYGESFAVILSDRKPDLLKEICNILNSEKDFSEQNAVEMFCKKQHDTHVYDLLKINS